MRLLSKICILFIRAYQYMISPYLASHCRFSPTCSHYAIAAFSKYSLFKAFKLSITRIFKCHPWHPGGYDPLP